MHKQKHKIIKIGPTVLENGKVTFCKKLQYLLNKCIRIVDFGEKLMTR